MTTNVTMDWRSGMLASIAGEAILTAQVLGETYTVTFLFNGVNVKANLNSKMSDVDKVFECIHSSEKYLDLCR